MNFDQPYNRHEFVSFLRQDFLPENDFVQEETPVAFPIQTQYCCDIATKLGTCQSLDLVIYEIRHHSKSDARVGMSKEAFRLLANEFEDKALVIFVPEDNTDNYRFSFIEITLHQDEDSSRVKKTYSNPRRYSYYLGKGIAWYTPNKYLNEAGRVTSIEDLRNRFSVEVLTKSFYQELSDWYAWVVKIIRFPNKLNDPTDDDKFNAESTIRLVTRLIFVWFLKQKNLIPNEFFDKDYIKDNLLEDFNPEYNPSLFYNAGESKYYKAILQNLFFAMLNSPITKEGETELSERHFRKNRGDYDNNKLMRYESLFAHPQLFVDLANRTVPFLNGGLFDCLDDKDADNYIDGFSDRKEVQESLFVPDYIFFAKEVIVDLSHWYEDKKKKKVKVSGILNILKRYNFTIEENTPFDQEVSLDPELLGKVFENLLASYNPETQTTARKQTGSFYTPREIVQYMVDESLVAHLKRIVGEDLEPEFRKLVAYTDEELNLTDEQKHQIMEAIYNCKVLDPACGSGAFPVGMLQQMVHILNRIDPTNENWKNMLIDNAVKESRNAFQADTDEERNARLKDIEDSFNESLNNPDYARKLYLIEDCIYGVDIQPIAIQISKLRFFISLVVDQLTNNDPVKNFGIRPLPNLEAKFVAANTLIPLTKNEEELGRTPAVIAIENNLKEANHKIFRAKSVKTKRRWKDRLKELRKDLATQLANDGFLSADTANQLASWDMFDQNASASFFDAEWMFGVKEGFDIVIGNPPYIQLQANNGELADSYCDYGYKTFIRTGDIYCLFYERGWQVLKKDGCLCFITSNKWMRANYGEKTRSFFAKYTNPQILIDFSGIDIFKSATVVTNILLFTRSKNQGYTFCVTANNQQKKCINNLYAFVYKNRYIQNLSTSEGWIILTPSELAIKQKIIKAGTPLKDWNIQIYRGILTGYNDAFIISTEKRDEILANCKTTDEYTRTLKLIQPILRGKDIRKYGYDWAGLWIINVHNGIKGKLEGIHIEDYPAIKNYLDKYIEKLSKRLDQGDTPYNLRNCAYLTDFSKPKVIYPETTKGARFAYDETGIYIDKTCFMLISDSALYLQKTLSSKLFEVAYNKMFSSVELVNHTYQYNKHALIKLPIIKNVDTIKLLSNINDEQSINLFIYRAYGLTYEEVLIIDPETPITREEYEQNN